jgi:hypothetical protein
MVKVFYTILLLLISIFVMSLRKEPDQLNFMQEPPELGWERGVDAIRYKIIQKYTKKYNLRITGIVDGQMDDKVREVGFMCRRYQLTSKAKARQILVEMVLDYLEAVNNCEELQPYLYDRPFTVKNIDLTVIIFYPDGKNVFHPDLDSVNTRRNKIIYATIKQEDPNRYIEEEESFEEAVQLSKTEIPPEDLL